MKTWLIIAAIVGIIVGVLIWYFTKPDPDLSLSQTPTPGVEESTVTKPADAISVPVDTSTLVESTIPGTTTATAVVATKPSPSSALVISYHGAAGNEQMDISVNGKVLHTDNKVPKTSKTATLTVTDQLPVKSVTIRFKNDSGTRDLYIEKATLDGKDIKSKFKYTTGKLDAPRSEKVARGTYAWGGSYTYTP